MLLYFLLLALLLLPLYRAICGFGIPDLGQIAYIGQGMDLFDHSIDTQCLFRPRLADVAFLVVDVTEDDGFGGTGLLAGCLNVYHVLQLAVLPLGLQLAVLQTLYAEAAFFHHTAAAGDHIRVEHHTGKIVIHREDNGIELTDDLLVLVVGEAVGAGIVGPVETSYFIRTVVGAIAGPDTAVIGHLIQPLAAVVGGIHRANVLTGSVVAMLTQH